MEVKASQDEKYLHPKESLITDYLTSTIAFNQEHAQGLSSGKKINKELDAFFREEIKR